MKYRLFWKFAWLKSQVALLLLAGLCQAAKLPARPAIELDEIVMFSFDDHSIPFAHGLRVQLVPAEKYGVVVPLGDKDAPDSDMVEFYGTVIRIGDEFRMWYMGRNFGQDTFVHGPFRVCYAASKDGIHWEKPELGLVEFLGNKQNNLVGLETKDGQFDPINTQTILVLYEPEDPNPERHFKMMIEKTASGSGLPTELPAAGLVFFSRDGLRWKASEHNPAIPHNLEQSGLIKFNGCYYVNGHNVIRWDAGRVMVTYASYDFDHWTEATNLGFTRSYPASKVHTGDRGQQVHMGASLWNRGNVIIGFYGMWQYPETGGNLKLIMDLGMIVSNDAIHYREPIPEFKIVPAHGEADGSWPALQQGQAFENVGDKTYHWYSVWDEYGWALKDPGNNGGLVRLAQWDRDRLGYFRYHFAPAAEGAEGEKNAPGKSTPHFITRSLMIDKGDRIFVNADRLSDDGFLAVEILDEQLRPLKGFSGPDSAVLKKSGLRQPVLWNNKAQLKECDKPIRIRVNYAGQNSKNVRVYAVYVGQK